MYFTEKPADIENFDEIKVDKKIFYKKKKVIVKKDIKKKRHSDKFKNPLFIEKDKNRKLRMIKSFYENNKDLDSLIFKWRECIENCIWILKKEYDIDPLNIFKSFNLIKYNINPEDYGLTKEDLCDKDQEEY